MSGPTPLPGEGDAYETETESESAETKPDEDQSGSAETKPDEPATEGEEDVTLYWVTSLAELKEHHEEEYKQWKADCKAKREAKRAFQLTLVIPDDDGYVCDTESDDDM